MTQDDYYTTDEDAEPYYTVGGETPDHPLDGTDAGPLSDFPTDAQDALLKESKKQFVGNAHKGGDRQYGWRGQEARWHIYKAHNELSSAAHHATNTGDRQAVLEHMADAYNHMLMAQDIEMVRDDY